MSFPSLNAFRAQGMQASAPHQRQAKAWNGNPIQNTLGMQASAPQPQAATQAAMPRQPMGQSRYVTNPAQMGQGTFVGQQANGAGQQAQMPQLPPMQGPAFDPNDPNNAALAGYQMTGGMAGSQTKV